MSIAITTISSGTALSTQSAKTADEPNHYHLSNSIKVSDLTDGVAKVSLSELGCQFYVMERELKYPSTNDNKGDFILENCSQIKFRMQEGLVVIWITKEDGMIKRYYVDPKINLSVLPAFAHLPKEMTKQEAESKMRRISHLFMRTIKVDTLTKELNDSDKVIIAYNRHGVAAFGKDYSNQYSLYWASPDDFEPRKIDMSHSRYSIISRSFFAVSKDKNIVFRHVYKYKSKDYKVDERYLNEEEAFHLEF